MFLVRLGPLGKSTGSLRPSANVKKKNLCNFEPLILARVGRRAPDYSSNLCPPKIWSIYDFFRGCSWAFLYKKKKGSRPKTPLKKSYRSYLRRAQIRWVIWRSSSRGRTNVQRLRAKSVCPFLFILSFLLFCSPWAKTLCFEGEKSWGKNYMKKCAKKCEKVRKIMKRFCPLVVAL